MKVIIVILWLLTMLSTMVGGFLLLSALTAEAAPAQGAAAALACGFAVIPYVLVRAIEQMTGFNRA